MSLTLGPRKGPSRDKLGSATRRVRVLFPASRSFLIYSSLDNMVV